MQCRRLHNMSVPLKYFPSFLHSCVLFSSCVPDSKMRHFHFACNHGFDVSVYIRSFKHFGRLTAVNCILNILRFDACVSVKKLIMSGVHILCCLFTIDAGM